VGVYPGNGTQAINYLHPHDCFGEMSFLENLPGSATVTAEQDSTELLLITRRKFDEFLRDQPFEAAQIFKQLAVSLSQRLRSANAKLHLELQFIEKIFSELKDNYDDLSGMTNADLSKAKLRTNAFYDNMAIQLQNLKKNLKLDANSISFIDKISKDLKDFCNLEHIENERHSATMTGIKVVVKKLDQSLIDLKSTILENQKLDN
ncbi:MAG: cyclic nucleotide-binding domain-containing protein, partial [Oligoflexales bacterium]|nr:cyclic nucleotide-binding domain-containing protein [Oligoflexales bacterium]